MRFREADNITFSYGYTTEENAKAMAPYLEYWLASNLMDNYELQGIKTIDNESKPSLIAVFQEKVPEGVAIPEPMEVEYYPITGTVNEDGTVSKNFFSDFLANAEKGASANEETNAENPDTPEQEEETVQDDTGTDYSAETLYNNLSKAGLLEKGLSEDQIMGRLLEMPREPNYTNIPSISEFKNSYAQLMLDKLGNERYQQEINSIEDRMKSIFIGDYGPADKYFNFGNFMQMSDGTWGLAMRESFAKALKSLTRLAEALSQEEIDTVESTLDELERLSGVGLDNWFKKVSDVDSGQIFDVDEFEDSEEGSEDDSNQEETTEEDKSSDSIAMNQLSQEEMSLLFNKLNKYLTTNVAYFKQFLGKIGENFSMNMFATKMVPKNYKESAIRAYKRLIEGEESADAVEILVEIQLLKKENPVKESFAGSLMDILNEADSQEETMDYSYGAFYSNWEKSKGNLDEMPKVPVYVLMDDKLLDEFNKEAGDVGQATKDDKIFTFTFADGASITQDIDGNWAIPEGSEIPEDYTIDETAQNQILGMAMEDTLIPIRDSVIEGVNTDGGLSFRNGDDVVTVGIKAGSSVGTNNQYSGYFTLIAVKTGSRGSAMSVARKAGNIALDIGKGFLSTATNLNQISRRQGRR